MNSKGLLLLAGLALVAAIGAAAALGSRSSTGASSERGSYLLEDFTQRVNDVARIEIQTADEDFAVTKDGERWGLEDRGGYPVKPETVKQTIVGVAHLEILERKTKNPAHFSKLGIEGPEVEGSPSKRVTLEDAAGDVMASVIVGDSKYAGGAQSVYVRRADEDQAWRCKTQLRLTDQPLNWLDRKIVQLERARIQSATLEHPDGDFVTVTRDSADEQDYRLEELPAGRELTSPSATSQVATWLTYLSFDDVRPADELDFEDEPGSSLVCRTFDGLVVRADTTSADEKTWARFEASYEAPPDAVGPELPPSEGASEESADTEDAAAEESAAEGDDPFAADAATDADEGPSEEDVRAEVDELNSAFDGWAFALPSYKVTNLEKRVADFLKELPEEEVVEDESPAPEAAEQSTGEGEGDDGPADDSEAETEADGSPPAPVAGSDAAPATEEPPR